jgi:hypothetical protein
MKAQAWGAREEVETSPYPHLKPPPPSRRGAAEREPWEPPLGDWGRKEPPGQAFCTPTQLCSQGASEGFPHCYF